MLVKNQTSFEKLAKSLPKEPSAVVGTGRLDGVSNVLARDELTQNGLMRGSSASTTPSRANLVPPAAVENWADRGDLWPGRSQIQEVTPGISITNFFGAKKLQSLIDAAITHIVICAGDLPEAFPSKFQYLSLENFADNTCTDLLRQLDAALPWIKAAIKQGGKVLLHCATGSSRSGAVLVAYLMREQGLTFEEALLVARHSRPIIKPNPGFVDQLKSLENG